MEWHFLKEFQMNNKKIFLAAPISGFAYENEYLEYRKKVLNLISFLRDNSFYVYSEIEGVTNKDSYDSPEISVKNDFNRINNSDIFLLLHPKKSQTSTLIELGYAYAKEKKIIIVGSTTVLPYLALGLPLSGANAHIIDLSDIDARAFLRITSALNDII